MAEVDDVLFAVIFLHHNKFVKCDEIKNNGRHFFDWLLHNNNLNWPGFLSVTSTGEKLQLSILLFDKSAV